MDRQDIDALLIGALYGELTPADEARLAAHLESHPADRGALDDLKRARAAVRESRIFDVQLEPPQAVSALLLQEAHRRAPEPAANRESEAKESWFFRFTRMFLAHPAMAAAAMLVLVVGVASLLYVEKGDPFAGKQVSQAPGAREVAPTAETLATAPPEAPPADRSAGAGAGSSYRVDLDDEDAKAARDQAMLQGNIEVKSPGPFEPQAPQAVEQRPQAAERSREAAKNKKSNAIVVDTPRPEPKELEAPRGKTATARAGGEGAKGDFAAPLDRYEEGVVGGAAGATSTTDAPAATSGRYDPASRGPAPSRAPAQAVPAAPAAPPPPVVAAPMTITPTKPTAPARPAGKPADKKAAEKAPAEDKAEAPAPAKDSSLVAWAKAEHARAVSLASSGDCRGAAKLAIAVESRAPEYYAQVMATDRALKNCQAYVVQEREAERQRVRATTKRATDSR